MGVACATPLFLYIFVFQRINGIFFFNLVHCIDHGCKHHKKSAECSKQKICRHIYLSVYNGGVDIKSVYRKNCPAAFLRIKAYFIEKSNHAFVREMYNSADVTDVRRVGQIRYGQ